MSYLIISLHNLLPCFNSDKHMTNLPSPTTNRLSVRNTSIGFPTVLSLVPLSPSLFLLPFVLSSLSSGVSQPCYEKVMRQIKSAGHAVLKTAQKSMAHKVDIVSLRKNDAQFAFSSSGTRREKRFILAAEVRGEEEGIKNMDRSNYLILQRGVSWARSASGKSRSRTKMINWALCRMRRKIIIMRDRNKREEKGKERKRREEKGWSEGQGEEDHLFIWNTNDFLSGWENNVSYCLRERERGENEKEIRKREKRERKKGEGRPYHRERNGTHSDYLPLVSCETPSPLPAPKSSASLGLTVIWAECPVSNFATGNLFSSPCGSPSADFRRQLWRKTCQSMHWSRAQTCMRTTYSKPWTTIFRRFLKTTNCVRRRERRRWRWRGQREMEKW